MKQEKKYYRRLDYIRILSCVVVLLYHLHIVKGGFLAVCTFFALSGYLVCISELKNKDFSIKSYYVNRLKKIYFPLLIVVFLTVIYVKNFTNITWINLKKETISVIFGYNNFWQLNANLDYFTRNVNSPFTHLWYISILMQFDLIFPLLFAFLFRFKRIVSTFIVFLVTVLLVVLFYNMSKTQSIMSVYYNTLARSFSIFFGVCFAWINYYYKDKLFSLFKNYNTLIFIIYSLIFIGLCIFVPDQSKNYALYMIITTIISVRLIKYALTENGRRINNNKFVAFIAKSSYEIYLVQYPVIFVVQNNLIDENIKIPIIIGVTILISCFLHFLLNILKNVKLLNIIICGSIIIYGFYLVIIEKDYSSEMKELENILNDNLKIIEEKNNEYLNNLNEKQKEIDELLESVENEENNLEEYIKKLPVVGIGDSVLLDAVGELYNRFPNGYFDGKISRSLINGNKILLDLKQQGKLSNIVILGLSTNGDYSEKRNRELMEILEDRDVFWINAVGADDPKFNDRFREFAKNYDNIHLVEWDIAAKDHPEFFYADGIHVKGKGIDAYVDTIYNTVYNKYLKDFENKKNEIIQLNNNELKNRITFYGNELLANSFNFINNKIENASFNVNKNHDFDSIYNDLKKKIDNNKLEGKIVFLFDKQKFFSEDEYKKIFNLCKNYKIYICNLTNNDFSFVNQKNVNIINFYDEIQKNENYLMKDKIHLTENGNEKLANILYNIIINDE